MESDASGRALRVVEGSEFTLPAQLVVVAVGQGKLEAMLSQIPGASLEWGKLVVDDRQCTGNPKVFAGGDVSNGGKEVVNAAAEGKVAARSIHAMLSGS